MLPPFEAGAVKLTVAWVFPPVAVPMVVHLAPSSGSRHSKPPTGHPSRPNWLPSP